MSYTIVFSSDAKKDLKELQKKAPMAVSKLAELFRGSKRVHQLDLADDIGKVVEFIIDYLF